MTLEGMSVNGGALTADGFIYCIPCRAKDVLAIDPLGEFSFATNTNMQEHPEDFGSLFQTIKADEYSDEHSDDEHSEFC